MHHNPPRGGDEITWEAEAGVGSRKGRLGGDGKKQGPRTPIIYVPDNPGSSLTGDRGNLPTGQGVEEKDWPGRGSVGQQGPSSQIAQGGPVYILFKDDVPSRN